MLKITNHLIKSAGKGPSNKKMVSEDVRSLLCVTRSGNHQTKVRGEVRKSNRKLYKQKGTGRSRRGDAGSNVLKGGGRAFGPQKRSYHKKINKNTKIISRRMIICDKIRLGDVFVSDQTINDSNAKGFNLMLSGVSSGGPVLFVTDDERAMRYLRNVRYLSVRSVRELNNYDLNTNGKIILHGGGFWELLK